MRQLNIFTTFLSLINLWSLRLSPMINFSSTTLETSLIMFRRTSVASCTAPVRPTSVSKVTDRHTRRQGRINVCHMFVSTAINIQMRNDPLQDFSLPPKLCILVCFVGTTADSLTHFHVCIFVYRNICFVARKRSDKRILFVTKLHVLAFLVSFVIIERQQNEEIKVFWKVHAQRLHS